MTIPVKGNNTDKKQPRLSGWDRAIADAKGRIKALQRTIVVYEDHKKDGDPWPGEAVRALA